jgi:hypothetical protein
MEFRDSCPFCKTLGWVEVAQVGGLVPKRADRHQVICTTCSTAGPIRISEDAAVEAWNALIANAHIPEAE